MKLRLAMLTCLAIVAGVCLLSPVLACEQDTPSDVCTRYLTAMKEGDFDTVVECMHPDWIQADVDSMLAMYSRAPVGYKDEFALMLGAADFEELQSWPSENLYNAYIRFSALAVPLQDQPGLLFLKFRILDQTLDKDGKAIVVVEMVSGTPPRTFLQNMSCQKSADGCWRLLNMDHDSQGGDHGN